MRTRPSHRGDRKRSALLLRLLLALGLALLSTPFVAGSASAAVTTIVNDGDQDGVNNDWQGLVGGDPNFTLIADPVGNGDTTTFNSSERDYPNWQVGSAGTPSGKSDIGNVYVYDYRSGGDLMLALAWDRAGDVGTGRYYLELNQLPNQGMVPQRTVGDRRITIGINGSALLECQRIEQWDGAKWAGAKDCSGVPVKVNSTTINDYFGSPNATGGKLVKNTFVEAVINLTQYGATSCPVSGYSSFTIRSQEGGQNGETSALKDRATGNVNIPSDCGAIEIVKTDAATGEPLAGATFSVSPNPNTGSGAAKSVKDNGTGTGFLADADPRPGYIKIVNVVPGTYTVTETDAPAGYFLPPSGATKQVGIGETATFSFVDKKKYDAPTIKKNAAALYDASYAWGIEKTVAAPGGTPGPKATQNVPEGTSASFDYGVTLTEGKRTTSNYRVQGTVTLSNTNSSSMVVTLSDKLADGTLCTFPGIADVSTDAGLQVTLPAKDDAIKFDYTCAPGNDAKDGTNTATVTWDRSVYPQTQQEANNPPAEPGKASASADYVFQVDKETNKTVTVTDNKHVFDPAFTKTWGQGATSETRTYTKTFPGVAGSCTSYDNTATITETKQSDSATATVCVGKDLTVSKNKVVSLTRTYAFDIDKSVQDSKIDVNPDTGKATAHYTVTVTDGPATDSNWVMKGSITVSNPNDWQAVELTGIHDSYNGGGTCSVDTSDGLTVPKSDTKTFDYTCLFDTKPAYAGTNTATVTWNKAGAATPSGSASGTASVAESDWTVNEIGKTVHVVDNKTVEGQEVALGEVTWQKQGTKHEFTYSLPLTGVPGQCVDYDNTAKIVETGQKAHATVTVCAPLGVAVEKTVDASYDRTYLWSIAKQADKTTVSTDGGETTFNYTVTAAPNGSKDSGWAMGGTITVTNPNTFKTMTVDITDVPSVGGGAACAVTNGTGVEIPKATVADGQVKPGSASRTYSCTFDSAPQYGGGTNTALATWDGGSAASVPTPVKFRLDKETDKVVTVVDNKTIEGESFELGTADWSDGAKVFTYDVKKSGVAGECTDYTNRATIVETEQSADATVTLCVQKGLTIDKTVDASFDRTYKWQIDKVADKHQVEITDGGKATFNYDVTVGPKKGENDRGYVDGGWEMSGVITVTNPNSQGVGAITADVTDVTDVGGECTVEAGKKLTVDPGETVELDYSCTFAEKPDYSGSNTATATWQGNDGPRSVTTVKDVTFRLDKEINRYVDVEDNKVTLADPEVIGEHLDWFEGEQTIGYDLELGGVPGTCVDWTNVAEIVQTGQSADETVTVCSQADAILENTVNGTFDRAYAWSIEKQADGTSFETDGTNPAKVTYTVDAIPGAATDSGWTLAGSLWVKNPNAYKALTLDITSVNTLGGQNTCALDAGQDLVLPASGERTFTYSCSFATQPAYSGTDTTTVSWADGEASVATPVELALDSETDKVVHVVDDQTVPGNEVDLGEATWNGEGTPTTFTYSLGLTAAVNECETYTNTASIVETEQQAQATVDVCGPEVLPEEEVRPKPKPKPRPPVVAGVEKVLPNTGGPQQGLIWAGVGMLLTGCALLASRRRGRADS